MNSCRPPSLILRSVAFGLIRPADHPSSTLVFSSVCNLQLLPLFRISTSTSIVVNIVVNIVANMSSSIAIPVASSGMHSYHRSPKGPNSFPDSPYSCSPSSSPSSAGKEKSLHARRPSLLSSSLSKQECTVINIGDPDGPPRLISYLSSSQGFAWNPEIFLPSYIDCDYVPLENRRDPVHEITLSDEESKSLLPQ